MFLVLAGKQDDLSRCAKELPIRTVSDMVAIPESERDQVAHAADAVVSWADEVYLDGRHPLQVLAENLLYLQQRAGVLAGQRRNRPGEDVAAFFAGLSVAANDTTRQTISHAMKALTDFPDERAWLLEDFDGRIGGAIEEFIRWASAVMTFRRTAATDFQLRRSNHRSGGQSGDVLCVGQPG